jgi:hypothetical protein
MVMYESIKLPPPPKPQREDNNDFNPFNIPPKKRFNTTRIICAFGILLLLVLFCVIIILYEQAKVCVI